MAQRISPSVFDKVDTFIIQVAQVCSTRPERAEAPSPGRVGEILAKFQFIKYVRKLLACIFCKGIRRVPFIYLLNFFCL